MLKTTNPTTRTPAPRRRRSHRRRIDFPSGGSRPRVCGIATPLLLALLLLLLLLLVTSSLAAAASSSSSASSSPKKGEGNTDDDDDVRTSSCPEHRDRDDSPRSSDDDDVKTETETVVVDTGGARGAGGAGGGGAGLSDRLRPLPDGPSHFGRIAVDGIDLSISYLESNPDLVDEIVNAVYEHGLIVFRNQSHLTPDDEVHFAKLFSHLDDDDGGGGDDADAFISYTGGASTQHRLPRHPSIALVGTYDVVDYHGLTARSPGVYGAGWDHVDQRAWHNDGLADTHPPPDLTTMRCIVSTGEGEGGETLFASSVRAAELLPVESLVEKYGFHPENVRVRYKLSREYNIALEGTHLEYAVGSKGGDEDDGDVNIAEGTTVPLVIRERRTGRRSLVGTYHVSSIAVIDDEDDDDDDDNAECADASTTPGGEDGPRATTGGGRTLDFRDANAYLAEAWRPGLSDGNVYAHRWQVGDLAAWSNRLVIHTATSPRRYEGKERLHTRIRMRSRYEDAPMAWRKGPGDRPVVVDS